MSGTFATMGRVVLAWAAVFVIACAGYQLQPSLWTTADQTYTGGLLGHDPDQRQGNLSGEDYNLGVGVMFTMVPPVRVHADDMRRFERAMGITDYVRHSPDDPASHTHDDETDIAEFVMGLKGWQFFGLLGFCFAALFVLAFLQYKRVISLPLISKLRRESSKGDDDS